MSKFVGLSAMRSCLYLYVSLAALGACAPAAANVVISNATTQNMTCSANVCSPTATDAVLNVRDLENMLVSGNATVTTTGSGVQAGDIVVKARLQWSAATTLALDAFHSIKLDGAVKVSGDGGVSLTTNDGGSGGELACDNGHLQFNNPSGTLTINGTPYMLVNSVASLASAIAANPSGAFALAKNFDAKKDGTYTSSPIATVFSGSFNGLGNTISNLSINDPTEDAYVGLFAQITAGAALSNVRLVNENVQGGSGSSLGAGSFIGGLVGYGGGLIAHSFTSGIVSGGNYVSVGGLLGLGAISLAASGSSAAVSATGLGNAGGLVGGTSSTISDSYATGTVTGVGFVGGLVGFDSGPSVKRAWASGAVSSSDSSTYVGGLVGINQYGLIVRSHASGGITCQFTCGGLVGVLGMGAGGTPKVSQSFATGNVASLTECAGGLVGLNQIGEVSDVYATGATSGQQAGGLVCQNTNYDWYHSISDSYSTGAVTGQSGETGGLLGGDQFTSTIKHAYWDMTTSGITNRSQGAGNVANDPGIKGLSDKKLKSGLPKGLNPKIWNEDSSINGGLPYLINNPPPK